MPEAITHASAVLDKGIIWLLGGFVGNSPGPSTNHVWKYNIAANSWSAGPPLPADRSSGGAEIVGRTLHFFGGATRSAARVHDDTDKREHWTLQLDSASPVWTPAPAMLNPRNHPGVASVGTRLYAIGGQHPHDEGTSSQVQVDIYDTVSKKWSRGGRSAGRPQPHPAERQRAQRPHHQLWWHQGRRPIRGTYIRRVRL